MYGRGNRRKRRDSSHSNGTGFQPVSHRQDADATLFFLRCLFLRLAFEQRDLFDARRIGRAPRRNVGIVFESVVNNATLIRVHWLKLERTTSNANALRQFANTLNDSVFAHRAVMFTIDDYFGGVFVFRLQETIKKKLNGFERFAVAPDQAPAFLGVDL